MGKPSFKPAISSIFVGIFAVCYNKHGIKSTEQDFYQFRGTGSEFGCDTIYAAIKITA